MTLVPAIVSLVVSVSFTVLAVTHPGLAPVMAAVAVGITVAGLLWWSSRLTRSRR